MKIYQIDAFTRQVFGGNPAAVVPLDQWLDDAILQSIAAENNLAETAFTVPRADDWELRWFTPLTEVALCGHATLATAHVLVNHLGATARQLHFHTRQSGTLIVEQQEDGKLAMSFPSIPVTTCTETTTVYAALGCDASTLFRGNYSANEFDYMAVFESEEQVASLKPDFGLFRPLTSRGVIATAPGNTHDFVSRYFAPNAGIAEDPVTGSAHCLLAPYWGEQLAKKTMDAQQISTRTGDVQCTLMGNDKVIISGYAADYLIGDISI